MPQDRLFSGLPVKCEVDYQTKVPAYRHSACPALSFILHVTKITHSHKHSFVVVFRTLRLEFGFGLKESMLMCTIEEDSEICEALYCCV
jgi:hypothetical protein